MTVGQPILEFALKLNCSQLARKDIPQSRSDYGKWLVIAGLNSWSAACNNARNYSLDNGLNVTLAFGIWQWRIFHMTSSTYLSLLHCRDDRLSFFHLSQYERFWYPLYITLTTASATLCKPDSDTLTTDTQQPVGKGESIQKYPGLAAEHPVGQSEV